ncbi:type II toxin-antitoxin system VapC family toxin [Moraxellaceae bacterium AER2_44_116]|nr:type II toxin-antitoxin system VapC family toxin [Moraxellaceae bacterium]TQC97255.1 type II toxin-antitoxin system VapC family toxin [Moraxellaceae bacterium AER2_44_116]
MYLLDTNVVSETRKSKPHGAVLAWLKATPEKSLYLSAVTLGEIQAGIEITRERDMAKAAEIEIWLEQLAQSFQILPVDAAAFRCWAKLLHHRANHHLEDALIAATAITHGLTVVTRNTKDFEAFGVMLLNPFLNT